MLNHGDNGDLGAGALAWMHQVVCGFHGHEHLRQFERDRVFLKCISCGHESPGWELPDTPPAIGDPGRHVLPRPLVSVRRVV